MGRVKNSIESVTYAASGAMLMSAHARCQATLRLVLRDARGAAKRHRDRIANPVDSGRSRQLASRSLHHPTSWEPRTDERQDVDVCSGQLHFDLRCTDVGIPER